MTVRVIQSNPSFDTSLAACLNRDKVIEQFLRKLPPSEELAKFDFPTLINDLYDDSIKSTFVQYIGAFLRKLHTKKEKKVIRTFF